MVKKYSENKAAENLKTIFTDALDAVDPVKITGNYARQIREYANNKKFENVIVAGFGKAAYQMYTAVMDNIDDDMISEAIIVTKYGHAEAGGKDQGLRGMDYGKLRLYEAGHPIPDDNGLRATDDIISLLEKSDETSLVVCLVSGGGSALLVSPYAGIILEEKQAVTGQLLSAGADISELNSVRKHISRVKGGRLAEIAYPAEIISLMISDVIGDPIDVIASGPTAPDLSTFKDATDVINKYHLNNRIPRSVAAILHKGLIGAIPETPKPDNPVFRNVQNLIIASNRMAIEAAAESAERLGFEVRILSSEVTGEAREMGRWLAGIALDEKKLLNKGVSKCLISGGETTVSVKGKGRGGRNTELALSFAIEIEGTEGITMLSAGTDGTDGLTDAAGAIVDGNSVSEARERGLEAGLYLRENDSYTFFRDIDSLLITGPTGTNVMDLQIVLIE